MPDSLDHTPATTAPHDPTAGSATRPGRPMTAPDQTKPRDSNRSETNHCGTPGAGTAGAGTVHLRPAVLMVADLPTVVGNATGWLVGILAVLATFFLTLGGVRYMAAGGDPSEVERAKSALRSAGIGYALALLAPVLLTVLKHILGV